MKQIPYTPFPAVDQYGKITTTFTLNGVTLKLVMDVEATQDFIEKLQAAIVKAKNNSK